MDKKELGVKRPCIIPIPPSLKHLASKLLPDFDKKKMFVAQHGIKLNASSSSAG